ncbi:MAG: hypothetical protein WC563_16090 [Brevundimonas sp.]
MAHWVACALLAGCTTVEPTTILMMYQLDAATPETTAADAAVESAQDAAADLTPGIDAIAKPDAATAPPDATVEDVAGDPVNDLAVEPKAWSCPTGMVQPTAALWCIDTLEVLTVDYQQWQGSVNLSANLIGCNKQIDIPLPAPIATPWASATWCGARAWCEDHGKRLCNAKEWGEACQAGADATPHAQWPELGDEWMYGGDIFWVIGWTHPSCDWKTIDTYSIDRARIRCCAD